MKRRSAIILIIALALSSCVSKKKCERYYPPRTDSVVVTTITTVEKLRDTVIYISDKSQTTASLLADSNGAISITNVQTNAGNLLASPILSIKDNIIYADCIIDSAAVYLALKDRFTTETTESRVTEIVTVEVNKLKWWQTGLMIIGLAAIIIVTIRKLIK